MKKILSILFLLLTSYLLLLTDVYAARVKDIAAFEGVRANQLIGYGLVVGLEGTGDKSGTEFTVQSLAAMLNRMGIKVDAKDVKVKNVAAVMVTAEIPPFAKPGSRIDVMVSSMGDAKSLQGGTLLFTPLKGADNQVYAVAQGALSIGGFSAGAGDTKVQKNHLTVGKIASGALIEKEVTLRLDNKDELVLTLKRADFTTAKKLTDAINKTVGDGTAISVDAATVALKVPESYKKSVIGFISDIEKIDVGVDVIAKVIVNERTGTIVMGENVKVSTVAVSHGSLSVEIKTRYNVSQPAPFSGGQTIVVPEQDVAVKEQEAKLIMLPEGVSLAEIVRALNAIGVTPRDLISILQAIKAAGALQADLEII
ncbi:MAG: flagellar basal body P-ring protein FlgI [Deltaproteobacteria bacterium]|nr:flagellar basal body P-ring protein FlgI [Deltaproteobacteria bacterium]